MKLWEKGESLIIQHDIRQYLFRMVHNQSLNSIRNKKNRKTYPEDFASAQLNIADPNTMDPLVGKELIMRVNIELEKLPPQCKLIFYKSRFEEKKYAEIALELNLSVKTIEVQIGKALKILRQNLFNDRVIILVLLSFFY